MATPVRGMSNRAMQAERTRQQILETATRLFSEHGYDATSIQVIANEMGLTKAAVYYHFRAKSDMLRAIMQPGIQRIAALLDEAEGMRGRRARIEHVVTGVVDFLVQNRRYAVMASTDPAAKRHNPQDDAQTTLLTHRTLALFFGDSPTAIERVAFTAAFALPEHLPDLVDLTDEELRESLKVTMLRILRSPS